MTILLSAVGRFRTDGDGRGAFPFVDDAILLELFYSMIYLQVAKHGNDIALAKIILRINRFAA